MADGDPVANIHALRQAESVVKGGVVSSAPAADRTFAVQPEAASTRPSNLRREITPAYGGSRPVGSDWLEHRR